MAGYECWRDSHPVSWAALPSPGPGTAWGQLAAHVPVWFSADLGLVLAYSSLLSSLSKGGRLTWKSRSPQHSGKGPYIGILWTPVQIDLALGCVTLELSLSLSGPQGPQGHHLYEVIWLGLDDL